MLGDTQTEGRTLFQTKAFLSLRKERLKRAVHDFAHPVYKLRQCEHVLTRRANKQKDLAVRSANQRTPYTELRISTAPASTDTFARNIVTSRCCKVNTASEAFKGLHSTYMFTKITMSTDNPSYLEASLSVQVAYNYKHHTTV
jgi:hypothetical protein